MAAPAIPVIDIAPYMPPDLREQFFIGPLDDWAAHFARVPGAAKVYAPNVWPTRPAEFREVFTAYYRAQERLAGEHMRAKLERR